ncbi:hypothetical protein KA005_45975 [bacterium]|nr:hypothetical protein [bacterium]
MKKVSGLFLGISIAFGAGQLNAASLSFNGTTLAGDVFIGSFNYGNNAGQASYTDSDAIGSWWGFSGGSFGGSVSDGSTVVL